MSEKSQNITKIIEAPFKGESKGARLEALAESINEVRDCLKDDNRLEYDFVHHLAVLKFISTVIHSSYIDQEDTENYLDAVSFILEMVHRDLGSLHDIESGLKHAVRRYFKAAGLEVTE